MYVYILYITLNLYETEEKEERKKKAGKKGGETSFQV